jgi:predicted metal-dependent hydrolase
MQPLFGSPARVSAEPHASAAPPVDVRRSTRRRKTVSAYRDGDRIVILLPARMSRAEEHHWVDVMTARLAARDQRSRPGDEDLIGRAASLSDRYLGGRARPASVRWVSNQAGRWGSCTVEDRTIRLSTRLQAMPAYVVDYVLLHELAHLIVPEHGTRFWALLESYPRTERARGFLDGWAAAAEASSRGHNGAAKPRPTQPDDIVDLAGGCEESG